MEAKTCHKENFFKIKKQFSKLRKNFGIENKKFKIEKNFSKLCSRNSGCKQKELFFEMLIEKNICNAKFNSRKLGKCFESNSNTRIQNYRYDVIVEEKISRMTHT